MQRNGDSFSLFLAHTFYTHLGNILGDNRDRGVLSKDLEFGNTVPVRAKIHLF